MGQIKNIKLHIVTDIKTTQYLPLTHTTSAFLHQPIAMADLEADFEQGTSGASDTFPQQCSALRKNGFVMIKDRPCKIVEMSTSKTGKHGHAKVHLVALDIFTGKKLEDICPSTHNMNVPNVSRKDYMFTSETDDGFAQLMDLETGETKEDLKMPSGQDEPGDKLADEIRTGAENSLVTVLSAMGEEKIVGCKTLT